MVWNILGLAEIFQQRKSGAHVEGAERSSLADLWSDRDLFRDKRPGAKRRAAARSRATHCKRRKRSGQMLREHGAR